MSHSFLDRSQQGNDSDQSEVQQKKLDPIAQLKWHDSIANLPGWGEFGSPQPVYIQRKTAQFFSQEEEEQVQGKAEDEELLQGKAEEEELQMKPEEEEILQGKAEEEELQMKAEEEELQMKPEEEELQMKDRAVRWPVERDMAKMAGSGTQSSLPEDVREKMENSFSTDFSGVNIHQNSDQASNIGALAYTQGNDVHFAPGQYNPGSQKGQELLGHELAHVVQQMQGRVQPTRQGKGMPINDNPSLEKEADVMGAKAAQGKMADVAGKGNGVQKKDPDEPVKSEIVLEKSIQDYKDSSKPEYDPSKISDADIEIIKEYKYLVKNFVHPPWIYTIEDANLAIKLAIRKVRAGGIVDIATDGSDLISAAHKQLEVMRKSEKYDNKLKWDVQDPTLQGTGFGKWILGGGLEPDEVSGVMNCWELVLFSAYKCGYITSSKIKTIYADFVAKYGSSGLSDANANFEKEITSGSENIYKPGDANSPIPLPGDIVFFKTLTTHTAISFGKNTTTGEVDIMSLWTQNSKKTTKTTIEKLLASPINASEPVRFYSSNW